MKKKKWMLHPWIEQRCLALYCTESRQVESTVDGWKQKEGLKSHWEGSNDGVGAPKADPSGELLQQAGDGAGGAGRGGLEAHGGAVGCQEDFPHRLQTGLTLRGEGTPGEETGRRKGRKEGGEARGSKIRRQEEEG